MIPQIILIGNPVAGRCALKKIDKAVRTIKDKGLNVRLMLTGKRGDAELFAKQISQQSAVSSQQSNPPFTKKGGGRIMIIAAGGDGTYNEIINGIAGTDVPMAILPLGTTNVLAKELGIPEDVDKALYVALNGKSHKICLGKISLLSITRYFILMVGIGYDGETVYSVDNRIKKYSGKGAFIWSGLNTLLSWNPDKLTFNIDSKPCKGYSAIICNASKYAGNFKVAPDAKMNEPCLYAFIMHGKKRSDIVRYVSGIVRGKHLGLKDITYQQVEKIEIEGDAHIQIDGDYLGKTPARIEIVPDALRLIY